VRGLKEAPKLTSRSKVLSKLTFLFAGLVLSESGPPPPSICAGLLTLTEERKEGREMGGKAPVVLGDKGTGSP